MLSRDTFPLTCLLLLKGWIDIADAQLATLHNFILPGGTPGSAALHMARFHMDGLVNNQDRRTLYRPLKIFHMDGLL